MSDQITVTAKYRTQHIKKYNRLSHDSSLPLIGREKLQTCKRQAAHCHSFCHHHWLGLNNYRLASAKQRRQGKQASQVNSEPRSTFARRSGIVSMLPQLRGCAPHGQQSWWVIRGWDASRIGCLASVWLDASRIGCLASVWLDASRIGCLASGWWDASRIGCLASGWWDASRIGCLAAGWLDG